jgi:diguanylate cyclase (GGDEF)-like protein
MTCDGHPCQAASLPLVDAAGRNLADMVLVMDTSQQVAEARKAVLNDGAVSAAGGAAVFALCFWLTGYLGRRMPRTEQVALQEHADYDELTGLPKRSTFNAMLKEEISRAQRYRRPLSLLMVDIDHFRRVNDAHGNVVGDHILKSLAPILQKSLRPADRACRYGGEEFILILPETGEASAREVAERLREAVEKFTFRDGDGRPVMITVSIGAAMLAERAATPQELVNAVTTALYAAKEGGRNRVCFYGATACDPEEGQVS